MQQRTRLSPGQLAHAIFKASNLSLSGNMHGGFVGDTEEQKHTSCYWSKCDSFAANTPRWYDG